MAQTCTKCSRVNPPEAAYCYFDGAVLGGRSRNGGPVSVATQPFVNPFVFPSGRACRNFDELSLACHENWREACDLLHKGFLQSFFGALGRADLSAAAREAGRFPDRDRALDQLLGQLPSDVLAPARLRVEPVELNLGTLQLGQQRVVRVHLHNQGMRLLHGMITCEDCPWLSLGDTLGTPQKHFQFDHEWSLAVHLRGNQLRAGAKPLEGRLLVESNGGTATIPVRIEVPVKPFASGVLAGAKSPRQVAQKARSAPKEAAAHFENGAVAQWYKDNGWTYPVEGVSASGIGAVQQFFEALGLTEPPKVEISERSVSLRGDPGRQLRHVLRVETQEKRPVYAHGRSNQPWLEVGKPQLNGRVATIPIVVPAVPQKPGETLTAKVRIQANGNQRFTVPITLTVGAPPESVFDFGNLAAAEVPPPAAPAPTAPPPTVPPPVLVRRRQPAQPFPWVHALPAVLLLAILAGLVAWDLVKPKKSEQPAAELTFTDEDDILPPSKAKDQEPRLQFEFTEHRMRFGIQMVKEQDPQNPDKRKRLTYEERGESNNTCVWLDGSTTRLLGQSPGEWLRLPKDLVDEPVLRSFLGPRDTKWLRSHQGRELAKVELVGDRRGFLSVWKYREGLRIYQTVQLVVGEQTQLLDTVLVHYTIENRSEGAHTVGLRVMLDTFIGANDGVPFTIPGQKDLLTTMQDFAEKDIPDYIQALERGDPDDPGTVAHMGLKGFHLSGVTLDPIEKLRICRWPGSEVRWDWEPKSIDDNSGGGQEKDSCVALYWMPRPLEAGERRDMAFTYGLNRIAATGRGSRLGLTAGGNFRVGGEFTLTAYVKNPEAGQRVKLEALPDGLSLIAGQEQEQAVQAGGEYGQVSWRIRATKAAKHTLTATSGTARVEYPVTIRTSGIFER
jgi:hypothetical protein